MVLNPIMQTEEEVEEKEVEEEEQEQEKEKYPVLALLFLSPPRRRPPPLSRLYQAITSWQMRPMMSVYLLHLAYRKR